MDIFVTQDAWLSALLFAALMFVGWGLGSLMRKWGGNSPATSTRIEDGSLALFGLLLAFCFSGAAGRFEARKDLLQNDVVAIADFASVASMLEEPERHALLNELETYVQQRMAFGKIRLEDSKMPQLIEDGQKTQMRMLAIVRQAITHKNTPSIHTPLINAFNGLTAAHDHRLFGLRDHVNAHIVWMMVLFGVFTTFTMGRLHEPSGKSGLFRIGSYIALVALVFFVTIDLEQPRRGLILLSQTPMLELSHSIQAMLAQ